SCSAVYASGTLVTLTVTPGSGASFKGWSGGGCAGTGPCMVTMTAAQSVQATLSQVFTNSKLTAGTSIVSAADVTELRSAINTLRAQNSGLASFAFSDPTVPPGVTPAKAVHFTEFRAALNEVYVQARLTQPVYTTPVITPGVTIIRAADLNELRNALRAAE